MGGRYAGGGYWNLNKARRYVLPELLWTYLLVANESTVDM
jgi:hypothetical protein